MEGGRSTSTNSELAHEVVGKDHNFNHKVSELSESSANEEEEEEFVFQCTRKGL